MDTNHLPLPSDSFDTVVQTFGLCSLSDPLSALSEMKRVVKPHGNILLLEHGRSNTWNWLNVALDKTDKDHAEKWGCHWNRDILGLVKEAGLQVEDVRTYHLGTTWAIVIRKED